MQTFNRLCIGAACDLLKSRISTNAQFESLFLDWELEDEVGGGSIEKAAIALKSYAIKHPDKIVLTVLGEQTLHEAIIRKAIEFSYRESQSETWQKLLIGLNRDGFTLEEAAEDDWGDTTFQLRRMYPQDETLNLPEVENEIMSLLSDLGFQTTKGHLIQALTNMDQGNWASVNGEIRKVVVSLLDEIAHRIDPGSYALKTTEEERRQILVTGSTPFLSTELKEWNGGQKADFIHGLINRLSPAGGHPGLSNEDDASFRLHIVLITMRLLLRRFSHWGT